MIIGANDLHLEFSRSVGLLAVWNANHEKVFQCEARNRTVADDQFGHFGNIPDGDFLLGTPVPKNSIPFGPWFIPVLDYQGHHAMQDFHRAGIGLHGGGSGLANPFAARQGWQITEGCVRLQNEDLLTVVHLVRVAQNAHARCFLTAAV